MTGGVTVKRYNDTTRQVLEQILKEKQRHLAVMRILIADLHNASQWLDWPISDAQRTAYEAVGDIAGKLPIKTYDDREMPDNAGSIVTGAVTTGDRNDH